jgi:hypothetical protein
MKTDEYHGLRDKIATWCNRAQMAQKQNQDDLTRQALDRCWDFQRALTNVMMEPVPPRPSNPQEVLDWLDSLDSGAQGKEPDLPRDPFQPSGVPRRPLPVSGAGAIALPLPDKPAEGAQHWFGRLISLP